MLADGSSDDEAMYAANSDIWRYCAWTPLSATARYTSERRCFFFFLFPLKVCRSPLVGLSALFLGLFCGPESVFFFRPANVFVLLSSCVFGPRVPLSLYPCTLPCRGRKVLDHERRQQDHLGDTLHRPTGKSTHTHTHTCICEMWIYTPWTYFFVRVVVSVCTEAHHQ